MDNNVGMGINIISCIIDDVKISILCKKVLLYYCIIILQCGIAIKHEQVGISSFINTMVYNSLIEIFLLDFDAAQFR